MAPRKAHQVRTKKSGLHDVLISMGILLSLILFIINFIRGGIGWIEILAPVMIVFAMSFLLDVLKKAFNRL
mgnify:CR=1 FL=1